MSSAILYVAIVVIWACVLIPRWLRRDRTVGVTHSADQATSEDLTPPEAQSARDEVDDRGEDMVEEPPEEMAQDQPQPEEAPPPPLTPEESRRRMLSARRRLLGMLVGLEAAAISLAVLKLAATWVVIPPSLMLAGYLLILRAASHADAERAAWEAEAAAHARARARERARGRERPVRADTAAPHGSTGSATPARPAASAAQYEDMGPGRDFAPGLAGKYTTSNAEIIDISARAGDDFAHETPDGNLRAVGD